MGAEHGTDSAVEVIADRLLFRRGLGMKIDDPNGRGLVRGIELFHQPSGDPVPDDDSIHDRVDVVQLAWF